MTSDRTAVENLKIRIKQYFNEFNSIENIIKRVRNNDNEIPRWTSQHYHLNLDDIIDEIKRLCPVRFMREGNNHGEKSMKIAEHEFISQRENSYG